MDKRKEDKEWVRSYKRGRVDGLHGHPPAEATEPYLLGYVDGLESRG
jgi:hypothetical protein